MGAGQGAGHYLFSHFCEFESSFLQEFELFWEYGLFGKFHEIRKIPKFAVLQSLLWGLILNWSSGGKKNCIVYTLFCIFIIIINISISFVALLNCLFLNPRVSPVVCFPSPFRWGGRGEGDEWLPGPRSRLPA